MPVERAAPPSPPSHRPTRLAWIDTAKGFCILLVVIWHVSNLFEDRLFVGHHTVWTQIGLFLRPVRMPLFFFISGYLSQRGLAGPLRDSRARTLGLLAIHAGWMAVFVAIYVLGAPRAPLPVWAVALALILPSTIWYIWALPVYFAAAWAALRLWARPVPWLIGVGVALAGVAPLLGERQTGLLPPPLPAPLFADACANFLWFVCGFVLRGGFDHAIAAATRRRALWLAVAYAVLAGGALHLGITEYAKTAIAPVALLLAAQLFGLWRLGGRTACALAHVGRLTLPVYILHFLGLSAIGIAARRLDLAAMPAAAIGAAGVVGVPLAAMLLVAACRTVGDLVVRTPARFLFVPLPYLSKPR